MGFQPVPMMASLPMMSGVALAAAVLASNIMERRAWFIVLRAQEPFLLSSLVSFPVIWELQQALACKYSWECELADSEVK